MSNASATITPLGRPFLTVWFGQTVSAIGSMVSGIGVAVWVYVETGSAAWLGILTALAGLPFLLAGPLLPTIDRLPRRHVMIAGDGLAAVGTVVALLLAALGRLEPWHLAAAGFVGGFGTAIQVPAFQAAIPSLVDEAAIGRANGLNQFGSAAGLVAGPMIATALVASFGVTAVLVVDLATFVIAMVCTCSVRFGQTAPGPSVADDGSWRAATSWLRTAGRPLLVLLVGMSITNFFFAFFNVSMITVATEVGGTARSGIVYGAGGVAMIVSSIVLGRLGVPDRRGRVVVIGLTVCGIGSALVGFRPSLLLVVVAVAVTLASVPLLSSVVATVFHERVPSSMQGRVFGLRSMMARSLDPLGAALAGLVIVHLAEPAMRSGSIGAVSIGRVIGVGADRGAALVCVGVGVAVIATALVQWRAIGNSLDRVEPGPTEQVDTTVECDDDTVEPTALVGAG